MADRYIPEHRRTTFKAKNTFKPDELRRRREEQQVEIRKQKREENLAKRRGIAGRGDAAPGASLGASAADSDEESMTIESQVCSRASNESQTSHSVCNVETYCSLLRWRDLYYCFTSGNRTRVAKTFRPVMIPG